MTVRVLSHCEPNMSVHTQRLEQISGTCGGKALEDHRTAGRLTGCTACDAISSFWEGFAASTALVMALMKLLAAKLLQARVSISYIYPAALSRSWYILYYAVYDAVLCWRASAAAYLRALQRNARMVCNVTPAST